MDERRGAGESVKGQPARPTRRLLALNHFANPYDAPGGTRLLELTERLEGWDTTIVAANRNLFTQGPQPPATDAFRTVWTPPYGANDATRVLNWAVFAVGALVTGLRLPRPDVVYASSPHLLTGLAGWAIARIRRAPFVLEIRDLWPQILVDMGRIRAGSLTHRLVRGLEQFLYRRADAIVVLAQGAAQAIAEDGVPPGRIWFIPNAADPADFEPTAPREELRRRYGFDGVTILYAGAHGPANGLDFVLDAAAEVARDLPQVRFVLVGDGLAKPALMTRAARRRLTNVVFLEAVPKNEVPDLLAATDAGLHVLADLPLFLYGVSPNKLFDYMAAGLPVLTNTAGEVGEIVKGNDAGIVVEPAQLASGVRQLVAAGPERRRRWGRNGMRYTAQERNRSLMAARLGELLDQLTG
ncbi:glycosyltransferase family 4 protein [Rhabdothermincola sediminis]|uniref:glycosyltransferase family 4 protein n=1 Tax=Rhabdothermincola sediminis TaxID=2751370 RepID=UPI001AA069CD|nr:glycosyltransferase family 4 protein [Rhabdothermincola sediminis]